MSVADVLAPGSPPSRGSSVDVLLRDLDVVERWWADAEGGRFDIDDVEGHVAGLPTSTPVGEIALGRVLCGELPHVTCPDALRTAAGSRWRWNAAFSLMVADRYAARGDRTLATGMTARGTVQTAHAIMTGRGAWVLTEKGLVDDAGLADAHAIIGTGRDDLAAAVDDLR